MRSTPGQCFLPKESSCKCMLCIKILVYTMEDTKLIGLNLVLVFNSRHGQICICHAIALITKQPNLTLKTWPKQLLGSLPLAFMLSIRT